MLRSAPTAASGWLPRGVAQLGRALRSGRRGPQFKSAHPDHTFRRSDRAISAPRLPIRIERQFKAVRYRFALLAEHLSERIGKGRRTLQWFLPPHTSRQQGGALPHGDAFNLGVPAPAVGNALPGASTRS